MKCPLAINRALKTSKANTKAPPNAKINLSTVLHRLFSSFSGRLQNGQLGTFKMLTIPKVVSTIVPAPNTFDTPVYIGPPLFKSIGVSLPVDINGL